MPSRSARARFSCSANMACLVCARANLLRLVLFSTLLPPPPLLPTGIPAVEDAASPHATAARVAPDIVSPDVTPSCVAAEPHCQCHAIAHSASRMCNVDQISSGTVIGQQQQQPRRRQGGYDAWIEQRSSTCVAATTMPASGCIVKRLSTAIAIDKTRFKSTILPVKPSGFMAHQFDFE